MKEQSLIQMKNQINTLNGVCQKLIQQSEYQMGRFGAMKAIIERFPGYEDIVKEINKEVLDSKKAQDEAAEVTTDAASFDESL